MEVFKGIPFIVDRQKLKDSLQLRDTTRINNMLDYLIRNAEKIANAKGIYKKLTIDHRDASAIVIEGIPFHSKVLAESTKGKKDVFPYIITCGTEIEDWSESIDGLMEKYIVDGIKSMILFDSTQYIANHILKIYQLESLDYHIPGFLDDWSIYEQKELFALLGEDVQATGVYLTESSLMRPTKSVSGIYY
ncbi:MAG: vitamin B12 dependent methionine synthase [Eubacteriales bacterium]